MLATFESNSAQLSDEPDYLPVHRNNLRLLAVSTNDAHLQFIRIVYILDCKTMQMLAI